MRSVAGEEMKPRGKLKGKGNPGDPRDVNGDSVVGVYGCSGRKMGSRRRFNYNVLSPRCQAWLLSMVVALLVGLGVNGVAYAIGVYQLTRSIPATVTIGLLGDANRDGKVDAVDLAAVAAALNTKEGYAGWDPGADLNKDGIVDIYDLVLVGRNFGKGAE